MKKYLPLWLCVITVSFLSSCHQNSTQTENNFGQWKEKFVLELWKQYPVWASSQGFHQYDSELPLPDKKTEESSRVFLNKIKADLQQFDYEKLSDIDKTDYKLINNFVQSSFFYLDEFKDGEWNPASYNVGDAIDYVINGSSENIDLKLKNVQARLKKVPMYYQAAKSNLKSVSREHTDLAIKQNEGLLYFFESVFPDSLASSSWSQDEKKSFEKDANAAKNSITDYVSFLNDKKKNFNEDNTRTFRIGKNLYEKKFGFEIQSQHSASDIYQKALDRKKQLHAEMFDLTKSIWKKHFGVEVMPSDTLTAIHQMLSKLSLSHCKKDEFLPTIEKQLPDLTKFIKEKNLIDLDSTKPLKVRKTPDYMAGVAGASISSPGPYTKNENTYYNVTPLTNYSDEKAESYLREYNDYVLQILNIHEAIPGHYTQMIYANRSPSIIKTIFGNNAMIEGWACYVERMMIESGYNQSAEMQLFYDKWNLRELCNFLLDYNIQVNNWNEEQVMNLIVKEAFQQQAEAKEKYKRATLTQVQLCSYFTGLTEIYELREELKAKQANDFNLKKFHEQFLSYGSAPVKEIRLLMMNK